MSSENAELAITAATAHGVSRGHFLAFPCSYKSCADEETLHTSGVSASHVRGAFRCIGFDGPVHSDFSAAYILDTVSRAAQALLSYDALALYFCGHGFQEGTSQFLVAEDGKPLDVADLYALVSQVVNDKVLTNVTLLVLLDCCRVDKTSSKPAVYSHKLAQSEVSDAFGLSIYTVFSTTHGKCSNLQFAPYVTLPMNTVRGRHVLLFWH